MAAPFPVHPFDSTNGRKALPIDAKKPLAQEPAQTPPLVVTSEHLNLENDILKLRDWLDRSQTPFYELRNISLSDLNTLEDRLLTEGIKLRIDEWSSGTRVAVFRMPTSLHNTPGEWLSAQIPYMQAVLDEAAVCGRPVLKSSGDGNVRLAGLGTRGPDQQLKVTTRFDLGDQVAEVLPPHPRVVLETAYSQSEARALEKAASYLHNSGTHTHAVIVCKMTYPVSLDKNFKAEIAVWTRQLSGSVDTDFPFENSAHIEHDPHRLGLIEETKKAGGSTGGDEDNLPEPKLADEPTPALHDAAKVEDAPLVIQTQHGPISRRSGSMMVLNELDSANGQALPATTDVLKLNVYDLLRCCPLHPDELPSAYDLCLPLAPLRESMIQELTIMREQLLPPTTSEQTQGNTVSSVPTSSARRLRPGLPDAAESDRVQKKARRV
ncbi:hypothetical protein FRC10_002374 [Ceratobasidium sp. 414]|nr:hypothetical protein FRC10_002374 [Ceratobasidium sp. 414]